MTFTTVGEVLAEGFTNDELLSAMGMYETDFDKVFLGGYLNREEQLEYLHRARDLLRRSVSWQLSL